MSAGTTPSSTRCSTWYGSEGLAFGQAHGHAVAISTAVPHTAQRKPVITGSPDGLAARARCATRSESRGRHPLVEFGDHLVPDAEIAAQSAPERLVAALFEELERCALLLDPRVVAEIEDPPAVGFAELDHVLGRHVGEVGAVGLGGIGVAVLAAIALPDGLGALACVHRPAVGGNGDQRVVR